jgi:peptidoglycan/xylan/chitin deacetylase (PgdA/CDA1 family)
MPRLVNRFYPYRTPFFIQKLFNQCLWHGPKDRQQIYITFDDGPNAGITPKVFDMLSMFEQKATFFCVGDNVQRNNGIFKEILHLGHDVGNHTYHHLHGWQYNAQTYMDNVALANMHIASNFFRPPYGKLTYKQYHSLARKGYQLVMWTLLIGDYDSRLHKEDCLKKLCQNVRNGDIIVFHDQQKSWKNLEYILPRFLEEISQRNLNSMGISSIFS